MSKIMRLKWTKFLGTVAISASLFFGAATLLGHVKFLPNLIGLNSSAAIAQSLSPDLRLITSFRSPTCGCCSAWVKHMEAAGFEVEDNVTEDLESVKREHHLPQELTACHTAIASGYVIEGHIPAADVQKLLVEQPNVLGIAVPGMPIGSPGMESGDVQEPYQVLTFDKAGQTSVFSEYFSDLRGN